MPFDRSKYPDDWEDISLYIRFERAGGMCETCGAVNGQPHPVTGSTVVLTVAHVNHVPIDCRLDNLVAECQRCHLWRDKDIHAHHRKYGQPDPKQTDLFN